MRFTPAYTLLAVALAVGFSAAPALASSDDDIVATATVPAGKIADRYVQTGLFADRESAVEAVDALRAGEDFTVTETVTTTVTNPDGTTTTTTSRVERTIDNPNGPMGYGEVNITLALADKLVASGEASSLENALLGTTTTVTNPDGTTTTTTSGGVLALRAEGMGWGQIAKELDLNLGKTISAAVRSQKADGVADAGKSSRAKPERSGTGRPDKGERVARAERPQRPERVERPSRPERPERPERPQRPERAGRP